MMNWWRLATHQTVKNTQSYKCMDGRDHWTTSPLEHRSLSGANKILVAKNGTHLVDLLPGPSRVCQMVKTMNEVLFPLILALSIRQTSSVRPVSDALRNEKRLNLIWTKPMMNSKARSSSLESLTREFCFRFWKIKKRNKSSIEKEKNSNFSGFFFSRSGLFCQWLSWADVTALVPPGRTGLVASYKVIRFLKFKNSWINKMFQASSIARRPGWSYCPPASCQVSDNWMYWTICKYSLLLSISSCTCWADSAPRWAWNNKITSHSICSSGAINAWGVKAIR